MAFRKSALEDMERMKNLRAKNILVTGGTGFIGSHVVEELLKLKVNVITTYQTTNPRSYFFSKTLNKKTTMVHADVADFEKIFSLITRWQIDYILHLAACSLVDEAYYNPKRTLYTNIIGTVNILEAARLYPSIEGVIIASSDKAYGKLKKDKYIETDPLWGNHPYEVSKSSTDLIAQSFYQTYKIPITITRFGNVYGEGDLNFSRIIPGIMESIIGNKTLNIRSDGKYVRDYLYVKDVVAGCLSLLQNPEKVAGEAFNFGSNETLSVLQVVRLVEKNLGKKIKYNILNNAKNEIPYQSLNFSKIKNKLGWKPKYSFKTTLRGIFKWYKSVL